MGAINPLRSAAAVVAGVLLLGFMDQTLQEALVRAIHGGPPADTAAYIAVRNRPVVLGVMVVTHVLAATLAGYILAKVAGVYEVRHAAAAAVAVTVMYIGGIATSDPGLPPVWVRIAFLVTAPPALMAGATVRAEARIIRSEAGATRPEERS